MALIRLKYGLNTAIIRLGEELSGNYRGVFKEYPGNCGTIFLELLNRFWIPVSFSCVNIQQNWAIKSIASQFFISFFDYIPIMNIEDSINIELSIGEVKLF